MAKRGPKGPWKYTEKRLDREAIALLKFLKKEPLPLLERFCASRGYWPQVISNEKFSDRSKKFGLAINIFRAEQKAKWILAAAKGEIESAPAIFTLKNISDMRDEQYLKGEGFSNIMQVIIPKNYRPKNPKNRLFTSNAKV